MRTRIVVNASLLCVAVAVTAGISAPPPGRMKDVTGVRVVDYGIYEKRVIKTPEAPSTVAGEVKVVKKEGLVKQTDTIPLEVGQTFGLRYEIVAETKRKRLYPVTYHVIYPSEMTNPETGRSEKEWTFKTRSIGNSPRYTGFGFDNEWELLEGDWIFEISVGKHKVKQVFHLTKK
ncbi:MAG: DUF3859 domain-containing protein [Chitinivibrionales bacterium]|nr:DUF3859 domain-containing protein [Chitinivibrionales bacterium]